MNWIPRLGAYTSYLYLGEDVVKKESETDLRKGGLADHRAQARPTLDSPSAVRFHLSRRLDLPPKKYLYEGSWTLGIL